MQRLKYAEQKEIDPIFNLFKENCKRHFSFDEKTLTKYDKNNKHFSIKKISQQDGESRSVYKFICIYNYGKYEIQLEYLIINQIWKIISKKINFEEEIKLNILLEDINNTENISFDQQVELIINKFDQYFDELNQDSKLKEEADVDDEIKNISLNNLISTPSPIIQIDSPVISESIDLNQKFDCLIPPVRSNRVRQDSSGSSANSLKYAEFVPPSTVSIRRRRIIQTIYLRVEREKKIFENVVNQLKHTPIEPTLYELGLEFLRLYDGKFNYPQGYTFILSFKKRNWFLTINNIKCVECQLGEPEPRSVLILQYKNKFTTVQV